MEKHPVLIWFRSCTGSEPALESGRGAKVKRKESSSLSFKKFKALEWYWTEVSNLPLQLKMKSSQIELFSSSRWSLHKQSKRPDRAAHYLSFSTYFAASANVALMSFLSETQKQLLCAICNYHILLCCLPVCDVYERPVCLCLCDGARVWMCVRHVLRITHTQTEVYTHTAHWPAVNAPHDPHAAAHVLRTNFDAY